MKRKICKGMAILIFSVGILVGLYFGFVGLLSCFLVESYKDFHVEGIDDYGTEEYFTSDELDFARIKGVVIEPDVWERAWGEYGVYIGANSKTGQEQVVVKSVTLKKDGNVFFSQEIEQEIPFDASSESIYPEGIYHGYINCGVFTDADVELISQKKLYLTAEVQVNDGTETVTKEIPYEITFIQYMDLPLP